MPLITNQIIQALCRTLFHSLWQGLVLAALAGLVVMFTKKLRPAARYNLLSTLLVLFVTGVGISFYVEFNAAQHTAATYNNVNVVAPLQPVDYIQPVVTGNGQVNFVQTFFTWCNSHANTIVMAWLLVIAFRCVQLLVGLRGVHLLKHKGTFSAGDYWDERVKALAQNIHIKRHVTLLQSAIAKVPMVVGHFKPVILLPAGVLTALPQDEIEAILLHELAHIRRKDYLVNLLQNFCSILFFFNPAVLWLLSLIKDERENCCDDIALGEMKSKQQFIHALISFQEYNMAISNYAVGFPGRRDHLLNRVKRIITNNNNSLTNMEKAFLATGIVLVSFVTMAIAQTKQISPAKKEPAAKETPKTADEAYAAKQPAATEQADNTMRAADEEAGNAVAPEHTAMAEEAGDATDTIPPSHISNWQVDDDSSTYNLNTDYNGKEYKIKIINGRLKALNIDGEDIPADKFSEYQSTVDTIVEQVKEHLRQSRIRLDSMRVHMRARNDSMRVRMDHMRELTRIKGDSMRMHGEHMRELMRVQGDSLRVRGERMRELSRVQGERMRIQGDSMRARGERMRELSRVQGERMRIQGDSLRARGDRMRELMRVKGDSMRVRSARMHELMRIQGDSLRVRGERMRELSRIQGEKLREQGRLMRLKGDTLRMRGAEQRRLQREFVQGIIDDLYDENVIKDKDNLTFKLNDTELIVNGNKQPDALYKKMKLKYLKSAEDHIVYARSGETSSSDISIHSAK